MYYSMLCLFFSDTCYVRDEDERTDSFFFILTYRQISTTLIDSCANLETQEFDPPLSTTVKLAARTLQLLTEAGGSMALQELKERVGLEAESRGETDSLGVQAVYGLVACHLIHIDRSTKTNLVTFT